MCLSNIPEAKNSSSIISVTVIEKCWIRKWNTRTNKMSQQREMSRNVTPRSMWGNC